MRAAVVLAVLVGLTAAIPAGAGEEARAATERFVATLASVQIRDLVVEQTITLYHPDGRHPASRGEQRLLIKPPGRQRLEEVIDGRREVRIQSGGRMWIRRADGKTYEAPSDRHSSQPYPFIPVRRSADELLATWRALGIRDDVTDTIRTAGRTLTLIGATAGDRASPAVWLDPERGVVRVIRRERLPTGPALVDVAFSDHRPLRGGFQFPHRQEAFVDGRLVLVVDVRSAMVDVDLADSLFDPEALRSGR
jgi:hypothetical protein